MAGLKGAFAETAAQSYYAFNRHPSLPRLIKVLRACTLILVYIGLPTSRWEVGADRRRRDRGSTH
jgi:hypothetical protein